MDTSGTMEIMATSSEGTHPLYDKWVQVWSQLSYILVGETLTNDSRLWKLINGITISPKKSFCIIKIWLKNCSMQNPTQLTRVHGLSIHGCLFKRHKPEF